MTKFFLILSFLVSVSLFAMDTFPEGTFSGTGVKIFPDGKKKTYQVSMTIKANRLDFRYEFPGIAPIDFSLQMTFDKNGFFRVGNIGAGYCGEMKCHWEVTLAENDTEEWTLFFNGNRLEKLGSRNHAGQKNFWEESLILE